jgi:predicted PurR-regulated permease PerM
VSEPRRIPLWDVAAITATVLVVGLVALAVYAARGALLLVFVGFFLATGLEPAIRWCVAKGLRRGLALVLVVLALLLVGAGLIAVLVVPAVREIGALGQQLPQFLASLGQRTGGSFGQALNDPAHHDQLQQALSRLGPVITGAVTTVFGVLGAVFGSVFSALTVLVLLVYFTLAMPRIRAGIDRMLVREDRIATADQALGRIGGYVSGQLIVSGIAGVVSFLFFLIAGVPYPALLGIVVAVLDAIPQIGATLASLVGILAALSVSVGLAVATLLFFCAYQGLENYLIAPRVFSKAIELSPVAAFVAVLVGGFSGGLLGAITALPLTAAGKVIIRQAMAERRGVTEGSPAAPTE